ASGAQGLGAYRPGTRAPEYTGSVPEQRVAAAPAKPSGHWTWNGGTPVVVGEAQVQTPHVAAPRIEPARVEPARHAAMPASAHAGVAATDVHIVQPGE